MDGGLDIYILRRLVVMNNYANVKSISSREVGYDKMMVGSGKGLYKFETLLTESREVAATRRSYERPSLGQKQKACCQCILSKLEV
jgi:hypothetical protein